MTGHRAEPRPARLGAAFAALVVTLVSLLGGIGVLPVGAGPAAASGDKNTDEPASLTEKAVPRAVPTAPADVTTEPRTAQVGSPDTATTSTALPDDTGEGRRVVFAMGDQRVWLVDDDNEVVRTYLVSGSLTDNLDPGTYEVFSQSRRAVGINGSGTMQHFTRFAHGANAAIGFHSIPTKNGEALQTRAQLGTPQSHGCIRLALPDAKRLYAFAPVGTKVVVTA